MDIVLHSDQHKVDEDCFGRHPDERLEKEVVEEKTDRVAKAGRGVIRSIDANDEDDERNEEREAETDQKLAVIVAPGDFRSGSEGREMMD